MNSTESTLTNIDVLASSSEFDENNDEIECPPFIPITWKSTVPRYIDNDNLVNISYSYEISNINNFEIITNENITQKIFNVLTSPPQLKCNDTGSNKCQETEDGTLVNLEEHGMNTISAELFHETSPDSDLDNSELSSPPKLKRNGPGSNIWTETEDGTLINWEERGMNLNSVELFHKTTPDLDMGIERSSPPQLIRNIPGSNIWTETEDGTLYNQCGCVIPKPIRLFTTVEKENIDEEDTSELSNLSALEKGIASGHVQVRAKR